MDYDALHRVHMGLRQPRTGFPSVFVLDDSGLYKSMQVLFVLWVYFLRFFDKKWRISADF
jgi:hypothetical protein